MTWDEVKARMAEDRKNGIYRISACLLTSRCRLAQRGLNTYVRSDHYYPRALGAGQWMYGMVVIEGIPWKRG